MQYRTFGKVDWRPSALGFGIMRLPVHDNDPKQIDEQQSMAMVHKAIDLGVNYLDTAYGYHGGQSEGFVAKCLVNGYRERVKVATKMPMWLVKEPADLDRYFEEQRERLQMERIDFYLLHSLDRARWETTKELKVLEWADKRRAEGYFDYFGFSFHADLDCFKEIIDGYDGWDMCQIQYNYMDAEYQAGTAGLRYAAERDIGVVVMEPLRGGMLANDPPPAVAAMWQEARAAGADRSPADWALQWLWNQPEVAMLLSGMSSMDHVLENVASAAGSGAGTLAEADFAVIDRVRREYERLAPVGCTACEYCMPCPSGVNIPRFFEEYNSANMYPGYIARVRRFYARAEDKDKASACTACGECVPKCPQGLAIPELLAQVHRVFGEGEKLESS